MKCCLIGFENRAVGRKQPHELKLLVEDRAKPSLAVGKGVLRSFSSRDIAEAAAENRRVGSGHVDSRHRQLTVDRLAAAPDALELARGSKDPRVAGLAVALQILVVLRSVGLGHEEPNVLPAQLVGNPPEDFLHGTARIEHRAVVVDGHDGIEHALEKRVVVGFAQLECLAARTQFRDVPARGGKADDLAAVRAAGLHGPEHRVCFAVGADEAVL